jgi:hypothetical protein
MRLLPFVLIVATAACGGVKSSEPDASDGDGADASASNADGGDDTTDAGGDHADARLSFGDDSIARDCAPNDGPAVRITIAESVGLSCRPDGLTESLEIYVWVHPITAPQTVTFSSEERNGGATSCPGGLGPCSVATSGIIELDAFVDGVGAAGHYELRFGDGGTVTGAFDASWCDPAAPILCG